MKKIIVNILTLTLLAINASSFGVLIDKKKFAALQAYCARYCSKKLKQLNQTPSLPPYNPSIDSKQYFTSKEHQKIYFTLFQPHAVTLTNGTKVHCAEHAMMFVDILDPDLKFVQKAYDNGQEVVWYEFDNVNQKYNLRDFAEKFEFVRFICK